MYKLGFPAGNYSGITNIRDGVFALVSDKHAGFFLWDSSAESQVSFIAVEQQQLRDSEGIAYFAPANTVFIAAESDQRILEYTLDGYLTGRELKVPEKFSTAHLRGNSGFESLSYNAKTHRFWTVTEQPLLGENDLRLLEFNDQLELIKEYKYNLSAPQVKHNPRLYAFGVSELTAMDDGTVLVLEREAYIAQKYLGSWVNHQLYRYNPADGSKVLVKSFKTQLTAFHKNLANYEGMCLEPNTSTLLLVSDSQNNAGNPLFHLKDYLMRIPEEELFRAIPELP